MSIQLFRKFLFVPVLFLTSELYAQGLSDAYRYSFLNPTATARSMGIANAVGAVGGDFASLSINPAGIGIYRSSEVMFTPSVKFNGARSHYLNEESSEANSRFNFNNLGVVFTKSPRGKRYDKTNWKSFSFGMGINRLADFNRNYSYGGLMKGSGNNYSSFSEMFLYDNGALGDLAYNTYLIDDGVNGLYTVANWEDGLYQQRYVEERGGINELTFSFGGNFQEKLMLGATIGLPIINYTRDEYFQETDASGDLNNDFRAFRFNESLQTEGLGFGLKLGAIYKIADPVRIGFALHTPTWYVLSDYYNASLSTNTENFKQNNFPDSDGNPVSNGEAPEQVFDYNLRTPWKLILSATTIIGKHGFISADYELVDYASARFGFDRGFDVEESLTNEDMRSNFRTASNFRIGAEGRLENFFIRAGFGFYGSPFAEKSTQANPINYGGNRINISGGIGYRTNRFFADLALMHTMLDEESYPYILPEPVVLPMATIQNRWNNVALTFGFKF